MNDRDFGSGIYHKKEHKFAALRIVEGGMVLHLEYGDCTTPAALVDQINNYSARFGNTVDISFAAVLNKIVPISQSDFLNHWDNLVRGDTPRLKAVLDVDFDDNTFGIMKPGGRMAIYSLDDALAAAQLAHNEDSVRPIKRQEVFEQHLAGREIPLDSWPQMEQTQG